MLRFAASSTSSRFNNAGRHFMVTKVALGTHTSLGLDF
jgi:hypothetical protein